MLDGIFSQVSLSTAGGFFASMGAALLAGLIIAAAYRFRNAGSEGFTVTLAILPMVVQVVIALVNGNVGAGVAVLVSLAGLVLHAARFGEPRQAVRELKITIPESLDYTGAFDDLFNRYLRTCELVSVRTTNMGSLFRLQYRVALKSAAEEKPFIDELRCRNGNLEISLGRPAMGHEEL